MGHILSFILLFMCGVIQAQHTYILEGQVQDYRSKPLRRVKIMIDGVNGIRPTYTNSEERFLMKIPKGVTITNQTPFLVNGVPVAVSDVQYSARDNFVQINTYFSKNNEKPVTRQVFKGRVSDKAKTPIRGTRVSVDGTYYHTNKQGKFQFIVTTDGIHQVAISHIDSLQVQPQLSVQLPDNQDKKSKN